MTRLKKLKIGLWTAFSLCFLWFPANFLVYVLQPEYMLLLGPQGDLPLVQRVLNILALVSAIALAAIHYTETPRGPGNKLALGLLSLGLVVLTGYSNFIFLIMDDTDYHRFTSPDGEHTIVAGERSFLLAGGVTVYERVGPFLYRERGYAATDDGHRPFCSGGSRVEWRKGGVEVTFTDGMGGWETISVELDE